MAGRPGPAGAPTTGRRSSCGTATAGPKQTRHDNWKDFFFRYQVQNAKWQQLTGTWSHGNMYEQEANLY